MDERNDKTRRPALAAEQIPSPIDLPPPPHSAYTGRRPKSRLFWIATVAAGSLLVLLLLACAGFVFVLLPNLQKAHEQEARSSCQSNLEHIFTALQVYARENKGLYPPLPAKPGRLMFEPGVMYPEYIKDANLFQCPATDTLQSAAGERLINDKSYIYLSHALPNAETAVAFLQAYHQQMAEHLPIEGDLTTDIAGKTYVLRHLRNGVERLLADDPLDTSAVDRLAAQIPVLIEWPGHHPQPGGNVTYLDGHGEFIPYPGKFPMTPDFLDALKKLKAP